MADLTITITVPEARKSELIEAFANTYNYQSIVFNDENQEVPNPQSKKEFALEQLNKFVKDVYVSYKAKGADATRQSLIATAKKNISGVTIE